MKPRGALWELLMSSTLSLNDRNVNQANGLSWFRWHPSFGWYLGAACLAYFADGRSSIPLAAWLFPAFMLRFVRLQRPLTGLAITYGTLVVTRWFAFRGMVPLPGILYFIFALVSGFAALTPYLLDRIFAVRHKGIANSLIFPATWVTVQFLYERGPFGSWGSSAYTQSTNLALLQVLAVSGLSGVTFLIGWFAGSFNRVALDGVRDRSARRGFAIFCFVLLAIIYAGEVRLNISPPGGDTVRIASLSPNSESIDTGSPLFFAIARGTATESQKANFEAQTAAIRRQLLSRTVLEADAGARIVFWSEEAALILKADETQFVSQGQTLAAKHHIYLGMATGTINPGAPLPVQNKIILITPAGDVAWQYLKAHPTPGPEAQLLAPSDGRLLGLDTPYGRLTAAICFDTDFPDLIAQASRLRADIILSPANDWPGVDPRHTQMAQFRSIEQGIGLVRQASQGLSAAYDYDGRPVAVMDALQSSDQTLVAQTPIRAGRTLYARFGDWLAWTSMAMLVVFLVQSFRSFR
jgi:apolipoprotein N-acyltransferase